MYHPLLLQHIPYARSPFGPQSRRASDRLLPTVRSLATVFRTRPFVMYHDTKAICVEQVHMEKTGVVAMLLWPRESSWKGRAGTRECWEEEESRVLESTPVNTTSPLPRPSSHSSPFLSQTLLLCLQSVLSVLIVSCSTYSLRPQQVTVASPLSTQV